MYGIINHGSDSGDYTIQYIGSGITSHYITRIFPIEQCSKQSVMRKTSGKLTKQQPRQIRGSISLRSLRLLRLQWSRIAEDRQVGQSHVLPGSRG